MNEDLINSVDLPVRAKMPKYTARRSSNRQLKQMDKKMHRNVPKDKHGLKKRKTNDIAVPLSIGNERSLDDKLWSASAYNPDLLNPEYLAAPAPDQALAAQGSSAPEQTLEAPVPFAPEPALVAPAPDQALSAKGPPAPEQALSAQAPPAPDQALVAPAPPAPEQALEATAPEQALEETAPEQALSASAPEQALLASAQPAAHPVPAPALAATAAPAPALAAPPAPEQALKAAAPTQPIAAPAPPAPAQSIAETGSKEIAAAVGANAVAHIVAPAEASKGAKKGSGPEAEAPAAQPPAAQPPATETVAVGNSAQLCDNHPCVNGATCNIDRDENKEVTGRFQCICSGDYTGTHCQTEVVYCYEVGCKTFTNCVSRASGVYCECQGILSSRTCIIEKKLGILTAGATGALIGAILFLVAMLTCIYYYIKKEVQNKRLNVERSNKKAVRDGRLPVTMPSYSSDVKQVIGHYVKGRCRIKLEPDIEEEQDTEKNPLLNKNNQSGYHGKEEQGFGNRGQHAVGTGPKVYNQPYPHRCSAAQVFSSHQDEGYQHRALYRNEEQESMYNNPRHRMAMNNRQRQLFYGQPDRSRQYTNNAIQTASTLPANSSRCIHDEASSKKNNLSCTRKVRHWKRCFPPFIHSRTSNNIKEAHRKLTRTTGIPLSNFSPISSTDSDQVRSGRRRNKHELKRWSRYSDRNVNRYVTTESEESGSSGSVSSEPEECDVDTAHAGVESEAVASVKKAMCLENDKHHMCRTIRGTDTDEYGSDADVESEQLQNYVHDQNPQTDEHYRYRTTSNDREIDKSGVKVRCKTNGQENYEIHLQHGKQYVYRTLTKTNANVDNSDSSGTET